MHAIRLIKPALPLRAYVRFYAQRSAQIDDGTLMHPITARATPLIEFILGDRIQVFSQGPPRKQTSPRTVVVGTQTVYRGYLQLRGAVDCFIIMFQPTGLYRLFSLPMHELTDRSYEAQSVLGAFVARMEKRLGETRTLGERVRIADEFLLQRSFHARSFDRIAAVASQILLGGGNERIGVLAVEAGLSVRQFERRFVQQVGMRHRLYARIARFEAALDSKARSSTMSWTNVAHEFGYYDQMHMVHDFKEFTGRTPNEALRQMEVLFRGQIETERSNGLPANASGDPRLIL
jgi:AraC-like DNA-binding protein